MPNELPVSPDGAKRSSGASAETGSVAPGWYPDPGGATGYVRYWGGQAWANTVHRANKRGKPVDKAGLIALALIAVLVPLYTILLLTTKDTAGRDATQTVLLTLTGLACSGGILVASITAIVKAGKGRYSPVYGWLSLAFWLFVCAPVSVFLLLIFALAATGL